MCKNNQELGQAEANAAEALDIAFLADATFGDTALQTEVLQLFLGQAGRLVPQLPSQPAREQADTAHLLKGSARGIGAWAAATIAGRYEDARPENRAGMFEELVAVFEAARVAIEAHLTRLDA